MTPIKTIIKNKKAVAKAVNYIGKSPVWLPANGEATVDFEIWSVASDSQKTAIKTLCETGAIELVVMVLGTDGEYRVINFDPTGGKKPIAKPEPPKQEPAILNPIKNIADEKDHIVKVGGTDTKNILESMGAKAVGFKDEDILPPREVKNGEPEAKEETAKDDAESKETPAETDSVATEKKTKKGSKQKA